MTERGPSGLHADAGGTRPGGRVVGTGAAALAAAVTAHDRGARVAVVERTSSVGGTTAVSGGGVWMPQNDHMAEVGIKDSRAEALAYMGRLTAGRTPVELLERYVDEGPGIRGRVRDDRPRCELRPMTWPDYHPEMEGAKASGRMLEPALYDTGRLGSWAGRLRPAPVLSAPITLQEATVEWRPTYTPERFDAAAVQARVQRGQVACGQALIGSLLEACLKRGIEPRLDTRAVEITMSDGAVSGLVVDEDGHRTAVPARAVVLASGGFEWNAPAAPAVPARSADPSPQPTGQRGRRAPHGHGGGRGSRQHERDVVVSGRVPSRRAVRRSAPGPVHRRGTHRPPLHHRGPLR